MYVSVNYHISPFKTSRWLRFYYWDERKSTREIAKIFRVSSSTVLKWMREFDIPRRTISESRAGRRYPGFKKGHTINVGKHNSSSTEFRRGENHSLWKGGCVKYWRQQARKIWEKHYTYKIPRGFIIHHRDEDMKNTDIENLAMLTRGLHGKVHSIMRRRNVAT